MGLDTTRVMFDQSPSLLLSLVARELRLVGGTVCRKGLSQSSIVVGEAGYKHRRLARDIC